MSEKEKAAVRRIGQIVQELPEDKREVLLAYGEGMAAVSGRKRKRKRTDCHDSERAVSQ